MILAPSAFYTSRDFKLEADRHLVVAGTRTPPPFSDTKSRLLLYTQTTVKMGCGMSTEEKEGKQRNEEIENQLKRDKLSQRNEIKMLLLGTHHARGRQFRD